MRSLSVLVVFICVSAFISTACSSKQKNNKGLDNPENGVVAAKVSCLKDRAVNYALYVPSGYDSTKAWPLIIAFDSHADGMQPVTLFKDEAEKYGYIVAGSNNSKNGTPWASTEGYYSSMLTDLSTRYNIDHSRIYTAGFSGGSRVASTLAIQRGGIAAVLGFSAGFPNLNQAISTKFDFLGVVGNADFNYNEMRLLDDELDKNGFTHHLIVFDGTHAWPPKELVPDFFYWLEFSAFRHKSKASDNNTINAFIQENLSLIDTLKKQNKSYDIYLTYLKLVHFLAGVSDTKEFSAALQELEKTTAVKNEMRARADDFKKESVLQQSYMQSMVQKDTPWWTAEMKRLTKISENLNNKREALLYRRLFSFLSIGAYSYSNNAIKTNQIDQARHFVTIYSLVDPENSETAYMQAIVDVRSDNNEAALQALEKAIALGFSDMARLQADTDLNKLSQMEGYSKIINRMNAGK